MKTDPACNVNNTNVTYVFNVYDLQMNLGQLRALQGEFT